MKPPTSGIVTSATDGMGDSQTMNTSIFNTKDQSRMMGNDPNYPDLSVQTSSDQMVNLNPNRSMLPNLISPIEGVGSESNNYG
jgi:hypothetical protein